jgi:Tol biopolymer transport system component
MNAAGGSPWRLSNDENQPDFRPSWSRDGGWIYFGSGRSGTVQIWKVPAGGGAAVQLTKGGGGEPLESPDGTVVYYTKVPEAGPGLWSVPVSGGQEVSLLDSPRFGFWAVARKGIYFVDFNAGKDAPKPVKFLSFEDRRVMQIGTVEKDVAWDTRTGFSISPDGRSLLYVSPQSVQADLMLVDNFR